MDELTQGLTKLTTDRKRVGVQVGQVERNPKIATSKSDEAMFAMKKLIGFLKFGVL